MEKSLNWMELLSVLSMMKMRRLKPPLRMIKSRGSIQKREKNDDIEFGLIL